MKKIILLLLIISIFSNIVFSAAGEYYVSCSINTVIRLPYATSPPMEVKRYFYLNNSLKKVYDKNHRLLVSEYEDGTYTIHFREEDRTERIIYNTAAKSAVLFGKQRRGYYYPWVGYNGEGNCTVSMNK